MASEVDLTKQDGATIIETLIALPLLLTLLALVLALASHYTENLWVNQSAYNASLLGAELDSGLSMGERSLRISQLAECLSSTHQKDGQNALMSFNPTPGIVVTPFNPANVIPGDPESRLSEVTFERSIKNLMYLEIPTQHSVVAAPLVGTTQRTQSPFFGGSLPSGGYGTRDCCGKLVGSPPSSCVLSGTYNNPSGCSSSDPGFYTSSATATP